MILTTPCRNLCAVKQNNNNKAKHQMKKISILEQFAADAIGAPAVVTGGGGACKVTKVKTVKCKSAKTVKCKSAKTKSNKSKSKGGCTPCAPVCW